MIKWREALNRNINDPVLIKSITVILNTLYNTPPLTKEIKIYLLLSASNQRGGGANIDEQSISVELSRQQFNQIESIIGLIWHETIHLCLEKIYFLQVVNKKFPNDLDAFRLIKEVTVTALFPKGILAQRFFQSKWNIIHAKIPPQYTKPILDIAESYVNQNKYFDDEYIEKIYSVTKQLKGVVK